MRALRARRATRQTRLGVAFLTLALGAIIFTVQTGILFHKLNTDCTLHCSALSEALDGFTRVGHQQDAPQFDIAEGTNGTYNDRDPLCALVFFGLGRKFKEKAFPSIEKYILKENKSCKVFVHTYDVRNENGASINASELSLLTADASSILYETEEDFQRQRNVTHFDKFFPTGAGGWKPSSMGNMIHQWHSISKAWELMEKFEEKRQLKFDRVGFFRPDVIYTHPIPIGDENEPAVIPAMMYLPGPLMGWAGLNDRMFYGSREHAKVWATNRFDSVNKYIQWQKTAPHLRHFDLTGIHSEDYMRYLLTLHGRLPLRIKNICFKRLRSNGDVEHWDCEWLRSHDINNPDGKRYSDSSRFKSNETDLKGTSAPGVIVLGMHRSGTSMLTGLLSNIFSWNVPGRLIEGGKYNSQNSKGFFENYDVASQNDEWMEAQNMSWDKIHLFTEESGDGEQVVVGRFNRSLATEVGEYGRKALDMYNDAEALVPWAMNDPRMCLTLDAWLPLFESEFKAPPLLFTYRNPLDVALSLRARKLNSVPLLEGLRLWIWYNREAVRLSGTEGVCRVVTSNDSLTREPVMELLRIQDGLLRCGLQPRSFYLSKVSDFLDMSLQHGQSNVVSNDNGVAEKVDQDCSFVSWKETGAASNDPTVAAMEASMYSKAMRVYCDLKSGDAFGERYRWPDMPRP